MVPSHESVLMENKAERPVQAPKKNTPVKDTLPNTGGMYGWDRNPRLANGCLLGTRPYVNGSGSFSLVFDCSIHVVGQL
jgi:hypothetical protein